jgi:4-amino-4-deoxy-L-arabinose transferase-like glycosyltransferase
MIQKNRHWAGTLVLGLYLCLGLLYSVTSPIFESSDEYKHFPFVAHLASGGALPVQDAEEETLWAQEGSQPPLYYMVSAALIRWINTDDLEARLQPNPHARIGVPLASDNKNIIIHSGDHPLPWQGSILAAHLVRLFSVLLGAGSILCTYLIGLALFPERRELAVGAMGFHAFLPMYLFISASVNNDNLVIFLASLTLLLLVQLLRAPMSRVFLLGLGLALGMAALTKLSALGLFPLAALALWMRRFLPRYRAWPMNGRAPNQRWPLARRWIVDCLVVFLPASLIAGWWYYRNWLLYGDPTGMEAMLNIVGRRAESPSWLELWGEMPGLVMNFWGIFGGVNVLMQPTWIYGVLNGAALFALAGLSFWGYQRWQRRELHQWPVALLLLLWIGIIFLALLRWTSVTYASQGRLLFPTLSALSILFTLGITRWFPLRHRGRAVFAILCALVVLAASVPFTSIQPAYARPPIITIDQLPEKLRPYQVTYGGVMKLLGYGVDRESARPGESIEVTLYWQALAPMQRNYSIYIQISGQDRQRFVQVDSYPGGGSYPTSFWQPGEVMGFTYRVTVEALPEQPTAAFLEVGLYDLETGERLEAVDAAGQVVGMPYLTRIKIEAPTAAPSPRQAADTNFDNRARLVGYTLERESMLRGEATSLILYWQVLSPLPADYQIFVHLVDGDGQMVNQADGPPLRGAYPTSYWAAGEWLTDPHEFGPMDPLGGADYHIAVGFYHPQTGQRLPVLNPAGEIIGDAGLIRLDGQ